MAYNIRNLIGLKVQAIDGDIGKIHDFLFDDRNWKIRYIVVYTGTWLFGKKVLISPNSVEQSASWRTKFPINLTKEKIKNSPDIDLDKPVSLQKQAELFKYYSWPVGDDFIPIPAFDIQEESATPETRPAMPSGRKEQLDQHLRSAREIIEYAVITKDDEKVGYVEDFIIHQLAAWTITHIVLDSKHNLPIKSTLIPTRYIKEVVWSENRLDVTLEKSVIESAPEYNPDQFTEEFEAEIKTHYKKHKD